MERSYFLERIAENLRVSKVVALFGPRQSGKTTLAREFSRADACGEDEELCGAVANLEFLRLAHSSIVIFSRG